MSEVKEQQQVNPEQVSRVLAKLFNLYSQNDTFLSRIARDFPDEERALLICIQCPEKNVIFGSKIATGSLCKFSPEDYEAPPSITVTGTMDFETFSLILQGHDDYGIPYDIDYAWSAGKLIFTGDKANIHRQILSEMFHEFRELLNIKFRR